MLLPLLTALICTGPTPNYQARVILQPGNTEAQVTLENEKERRETTLAGLEVYGDCLAGDAFELCVSPDATAASLWMAFETPQGTQVETSNMDCSQQ